MKTAHKNNIRLRELMQQYGLSKRDVSAMLHKAVTADGQTPAVTKWLANPDDAGNYRNMKDSDIELLELKLRRRKPKA